MPDVKAVKLVNAIDGMMKENTPQSYRFAVFDSEGLVDARAGGWSRMEGDAPSLPAKTVDRHNICSMSKMITAAAVLATLQKKNLSPDALVAPFLPPDWTLSAEVKQLSFKDFMTHHTGFLWGDKNTDPKQDGTSYDEMKAVLSQKPFNPIKAVYSYRNINLAIFRVVLPRLAMYDRYAHAITPLFIGSWTPETLASSYVDIVNHAVLAPAGVFQADCDSKTLPVKFGPFGTNKVPVLAYHFKKPSQKGMDLGNRTLIAGAEGWNLSVIDLGRVLQTLLYTEAIISEKYRQYMVIAGQGAGCGMNSDAPIAGSAVHSHGAFIPMEAGAPPDGAQFCGWFMCYDKPKVLVVALSNSGHDPNIISSRGNWDIRANEIFKSIYAI